MKKNKPTQARFAFFGTDPLATAILDELALVGFVPALVVAAQDQKNTRTKELMPSSEKVWALARQVPVMQPTAFDADVVRTLEAEDFDLFIVASFGKILPPAVLSIPSKGVVNVHPSLLPRLRGPSPIRSAILNDERKTGVSIMLMDEEMDHGKLLAQREVPIPNWPPRGLELDALLAHAGGKLLAQILPLWLARDLTPQDQNHDVATYCEKIQKEDGLLNLGADAYRNLLKIRAFEGWPGTYTFFERDGKQIRVGIIDAHIEDNTLVIDAVKPEGKREMAYAEFLNSGAKPLA